jgi:hypothetical protein
MVLGVAKTIVASLLVLVSNQKNIMQVDLPPTSLSQSFPI